MGDYDLTLGTLLIGIIFNTYLFGLVTSQFITYYRAGFRDPPAIKWMVTFLFILDAFHSIAVIWMAWEYCITNYGKPETLLVAIWPYTFTPIGTAVASLVTQIFLGWRAYTLSKSGWLYGIILILAFPSCALGVACGIKAWMIKVSAELVVLNRLVTAWLVMQVGIDALVTGALGVLLARSKTGFKKTDSMVNRLIRGAIQTGLFAGIFSMGDLITFLCWPETNMYGMFAIPIGRIYTNTLLDTLNARTELRHQLNATVDIETGAVSAIKWGRPSKCTQQTMDATSNIQLTGIEVQKDVVVFGEETDVSSRVNSSDSKRQHIAGPLSA